MGYHRAGFDVTGVDIVERPKYPFEFVRADAVEFVRAHGRDFDAIHASPPCQAHSRATKHSGSKKRHVCIIEPLRAAIQETGRPYVIENVPGAPLRDPALVCGTSLGLRVKRHRHFETSFFMLTPPCNCPAASGDFPGMYAGQRLRFLPVYGKSRHKGEAALRRKVMDMPWASDVAIAEAIPPAYTELIGRSLVQVVTND